MGRQSSIASRLASFFNREIETNYSLWQIANHLAIDIWFTLMIFICLHLPLVVCRRLFSLQMDNDRKWFVLLQYQNQGGFAMCKIQAIRLPDICNICSFGPSIFQLENICKIFTWQVIFWNNGNGQMVSFPQL